MLSRINKVREALLKYNIPAMFVTNLADVRYLSGFTGSTAYMLITADKAVFFTDGRYTVQAAGEVSPEIERVIVSGYTDVFVNVAGKYNRVLLQSECPLGVASVIKSAGAEITADDKDLLKTMRMVKDGGEIEEIRSQYALAAGAFLKSLKSFKTGRSEREWAAALEYNIKTDGADGVSFETIVASGVRGAMPHGTASSKIVESGEPVIIDFGSRRGYASDYTRMVYDGSDKDVLKVIDIVREAVLMSIDGVKPGVLCKDVDKIARDHISSKGFGQYFNHSLGHGVGLDVHELPVLNVSGGVRMEEGMVFTIEPGIYLPGRFGVRLEDTVLVVRDGAEVISRGLADYVYAPDGL